MDYLLAYFLLYQSHFPSLYYGLENLFKALLLIKQKKLLNPLNTQILVIVITLCTLLCTVIQNTIHNSTFCHF